MFWEDIVFAAIPALIVLIGLWLWWLYQQRQ
jgi:hypothetical protein